MAVGPGFNSPGTQAAIAKQAEQVVPAQKVDEKEGQPAQVVETETPDVDLDMTKVEPTVEPAVEPAVEPTVEPAVEPAPEKIKVDPTDEVAIEKALTEAGFTNDDLAKDLAANDGKFSADMIAKLKTKFDDELVDSQTKAVEQQFQAKMTDIREHNKRVDTMNAHIFGSLAGGDVVKGKEKFTELSEWCRKNLDDSEVAAINTLLKSPDKGVVTNGLKLAVSKWQKGQEKSMMTGDNIVTPAVPAFVPLTKAEFIAEMKTEKYQKDPAYASEIDARRQKTIAGESWQAPGFHKGNLGLVMR